jgi:AraC-like DNA-binding protein
MDTPLLYCNADWLCADANQTFSYSPESGYVRNKIPLSEGSGGGWVEVLTLKRGMVVSRATHAFGKDMHGKVMTVARVETMLSEPTLVVQSLRTGKVTVKESAIDQNYAIDMDRSLFHHAEDIGIELLAQCSFDIDVVVLKVCRRLMAELVGEELAERLMSALGIEVISSAAVSKVPRNISNILHRSLLATEMPAVLKQLYAEARILDYLCALTAYFAEHSDRGRRRANREIVVNELYSELTNLDGKIPKLTELAQRYGMTARSLNETFKEIHGEPIVSFITNHRLKQAHEAITESDVAIKALASRLGYSHVNHFTTAFRKKFGYPPGQLRR